MSDGLVVYLGQMPNYPRPLSRQLLKAVLNPEDPIYADDREVPARLLSDPHFSQLLGIAALSSAIHVPVPVSRGQRRIIKLSWHERWRTSHRTDRRRHGRARGTALYVARRAGWRAHSPWLYRPHIGGAGSHHVQVTVPDGVQLTEAGLVTEAPEAVLEALAVAEGQRFVRRERRRDPFENFVGGLVPSAHLYVGEAAEHRIGFLWIRLRAARSAFTTGAFSIALVVTSILVVFSRNVSDIVGESEAAAAVLLLVPALIASFLVRPTEHEMVARLLRFPRTVTALVAVIPLVAAGMLVGISGGDEEPPFVQRLLGMGSPEVDAKLVVGWALLACLAIFATALLAMSTIFPRAGRREQIAALARHEDVLDRTSAEPHESV